ncbi:fumarylacetoacetate hydrolase family protein [Geodermatophilus sabuli]|uniref:Fumarylacetoacetate hydrolase family protein n=1 Tax=Geodermatophilus sabuli TaxID=1564158 RepID=A0A7K3VWG3_9ACTN|nr:fumarylacetoacetate hydrolase family protein [Geodermatophilus sabuli]NEK56952.1 fumarylacetoacetate hydrolase family protein [Geodermatophilus sabuli]
MRLATIRTAAGTRAVRVDGDRAVETGHADVGELLAVPGWRDVAAAADGPAHDRAGLDYAPVVPRPGKVICVGVNYGAHIREMGRDTPQYPTLFAKFAEALIGAHDDVVLPAASEAVDWEAELAVVVGQRVRHADEATAEAAIAGYTVLNDVTARDWQYRTLQWLQGKTFEATTPLGPELVTPDEAGTGLDLTCAVDGEVVQRANTSDMVFGAVATIAYVSTIVTLDPGDVLALGTPGGVGHARKPPRYLTPGAVLTTAIAGLGECRNTCVAEKRA